jgi:L,D-transpeptidase ErfK/SrfK
MEARKVDVLRRYRRRCGHLLLATGLLGLGACKPLHPPPPQLPSVVQEPRLEKITAVQAPIPRRGELPAIIGHLQYHRIQPKETLLDVARDAGLGFHEIKDANPGVDEWVPPPGTRVVVPTRWILPPSHYRGLVVNIPEMRLYMFPQRTAPGATVSVRTWAIGIGTDEAPSPVGQFAVTSKERHPTWIVPDSIYSTMDRPRRVVPPGPDNPLGAYRIRLSKGLYSIHGTDHPWSIGRQTTHGCIRLYPEDIGNLYRRVKPHMQGELVYQPVKFGEQDGDVYVEVHPDVYKRIKNLERAAFQELQRAGLTGRVDATRLREVVREQRGVPVNVTRGRSAGA